MFTLPELARRCYFRAANSNQGTAISSLFEAVHRPNGRTSRGHKPSNTCLHLIQPSQPGQGRPGAKHYYVPGLAILVVQQPLPPITKCQVPTVDDIVCNRCLLSCLVHIWPQQKLDQVANVALAPTVCLFLPHCRTYLHECNVAFNFALQTLPFFGPCRTTCCTCTNWNPQTNLHETPLQHFRLSRL